jgi:hypothetical protein
VVETYGIGSVNVRLGNSLRNQALGRVTVADGQSNERAVLGGGDTAETADEVAVELRDAALRLRARMTDDGLLEVLGPNGNRNAALRAATNSVDRGLFSVANSSGTEVGGAFVGSTGAGVLEVDRSDGSVGTIAQTLSSDAGFLETRGPNGNDNVGLTTVTDFPDNGAVTIENGAGAVAVQAQAGTDGSGQVIVRDNDASRRVQLAQSSGTGVAEIWGTNGNRNVSLSARGSDTNRGALTVRNASDRERVLISMPLGSAYGHIFVFGVNNNINVLADPGRLLVADAGGSLGAAMFVAADGNGTFFADSKNFEVEHPTRPGHRIVYASVEGPEVAMFHRGTVDLLDGSATIDLPEHFAALAASETITVQLTPGSGQSRGVGFELSDEGSIAVRELQAGRGSYPLHYLVHAVRRDHRDFVPVVAALGNPRTFGRVDDGLEGESPGPEPSALAEDES